MRQIVLDTETTGLSPEQGHRVIEIGCVELFNRKLTGRNFHHYLNPERDSDPGALAVHGIQNEFLRDKPKFKEIAEALIEYLAGAEIIIHNAPFDVGFLNKELDRVGHRPLGKIVDKVTDTLAMAKDLFPGKRNSLDALCDRLGVDNSGRTLHGALLDAELLSDVYICMTRGQDALIDDHVPATPTHAQVTTVNMGQLQLPVIRANEQELAAHEGVLGQIDKASGGKTVWRALSTSAAE